MLCLDWERSFLVVLWAYFILIFYISVLFVLPLGLYFMGRTTWLTVLFWAFFGFSAFINAVAISFLYR